MHHIKAIILKPDGKQRAGRGFSTEELTKADLTIGDARRMEIPLDLRRKTAHDENVEIVKAYAKKARAETKPTLKPAQKHVTKDRKEKPKK